MIRGKRKRGQEPFPIKKAPDPFSYIKKAPDPFSSNLFYSFLAFAGMTL